MPWQAHDKADTVARTVTNQNNTQKPYSLSPLSASDLLISIYYRPLHLPCYCSCRVHLRAFMSSAMLQQRHQLSAIAVAPLQLGLWGAVDNI